MNYNNPTPEQMAMLMQALKQQPMQQQSTMLAGNPQAMPMPAEEAMPSMEMMQYLEQTNPEEFMRLQNKFFTSRGNMGEGRIDLGETMSNTKQFIKGLLGI